MVALGVKLEIEGPELLAMRRGELPDSVVDRLLDLVQDREPGWYLVDTESGRRPRWWDGNRWCWGPERDGTRYGGGRAVVHNDENAVRLYEGGEN